MSQHDFNIANQGFPATRSDLNNALAALASTSSGTSEPSTTYANQFWYDTTNNLLKFRNAADSAWITFAYLDQATNEWELRSAVIQAVDSAGVVIKTDDGTTRVEIQDDGDVAFDTNTLYVDSTNNNVGIGTSSPDSNAKLAVSNNGAEGLEIRANSTNIELFAYNRSAATYEPIVYNGLSHEWRNSNSNVATIDSSGSLLVGKTAINNNVGGSISAAGQAYFVCNSNTPLLVNRLGSDGVVVQIYNDSNGVGSISVSGSSTSYNTSSDYRLKEDWQPMTGASDRVLALKPVNFAWKVDGSRVDGFLAHEAQEVVPEAVHGVKDAMREEQYEVTPAVYEDVVIPAVLDDEGNEIEPERTEQRLVSEAVMGTRQVPDYQGIDQSKIVPLLTAALQEALQEITDLKARVTALELN